MVSSIGRNLVAYPRATTAFFVAVFLAAVLGVSMEQRLGTIESVLLLFCYLAMAVFLKLAMMLAVRITVQKQPFARNDIFYVLFLFILMVMALVLAVPALLALR